MALSPAMPRSSLSAPTTSCSAAVTCSSEMAAPRSRRSVGCCGDQRIAARGAVQQPARGRLPGWQPERWHPFFVGATDSRRARRVAQLGGPCDPVAAPARKVPASLAGPAHAPIGPGPSGLLIWRDSCIGERVDRPREAWYRRDPGPDQVRIGRNRLVCRKSERRRGLAPAPSEPATRSTRIAQVQGKAERRPRSTHDIRRKENPDKALIRLNAQSAPRTPRRARIRPIPTSPSGETPLDRPFGQFILVGYRLWFT